MPHNRSNCFGRTVWFNFWVQFGHFVFVFVFFLTYDKSKRAFTHELRWLVINDWWSVIVIWCLVMLKKKKKMALLAHSLFKGITFRLKSTNQIKFKMSHFELQEQFHPLPNIKPLWLFVQAARHNKKSKRGTAFYQPQRIKWSIALMSTTYILTSIPFTEPHAHMLLVK